ncbi:MAG: excinuclease ABC subunit UvrB [Ruminococcaceae bacterium]|nr:excinuclease ABC subunit UvrB [Oscillospiraceae bacterium]
MERFELVSEYAPAGDQPEAIDALVAGIENGLSEQTLLGVTGSGKTYTMAQVIQRVQKPTLILAHNKTLVSQLYSEMREFFPNNAVEYFVSYFDYYRPESYLPQQDMYIEKDSARNDEIDRLRHSATCALFERKDVIVVASVSCIYGLGDPEDYTSLVVSLRPGMEVGRDHIISRLIDIQYTRNDVNFTRGTFRVRGDTIELIPSWSDEVAVRIELFGDEVDRISEVQVLSGKRIRDLNHVMIYPNSHHTTSDEKKIRALKEIEEEMWERVKWFEEHGKLIEAQRIRERTMNDLELLSQIGMCSGIENYSRIFSNRAPGSAPYTLLDYMPKDFLMMIDESHVSVPQVRGMYAGDRSRKETLVQYGFRLPSALDNRPLTFDEFTQKQNQTIYVSATPGEYERSRSGQIVEQVIRPTGLVDPIVEVRPIDGQIDDLIGEINARTEKNERTLVTTLTKKMAEDLTKYLENAGVRVRYMHHDVHTMERIELLRDLRLGKFDVLVGINLLREGLDLPEVSLVAVLDADKEGFLRSETSLIQTIGRAARNAEGKVILYADKITDSMAGAMRETERRRKLQIAFNEKHGIIPKTVSKGIRDLIDISAGAKQTEEKPEKYMTAAEKAELVEKLKHDMRVAAKAMEFEYAALLRDRIIELAGKV